MQLIDFHDLYRIVESIGLKAFNQLVLERLESDFLRWPEFNKSPRHATHNPMGVIELMPCSDAEYYTFKYVNGHPGNPRLGKSSVVAIGVMSDVATGYPLMISEMTVLTAIRTAAVAALGFKYLARSDSAKLALIGTGAQAEFLVHALSVVMAINEISYFDIDTHAMHKFSRNLVDSEFVLIPANSATEAIASADVIVTATADKCRNQLFDANLIGNGVHIHAMGGDCPGKTELDPKLLVRSKMIVEYTDQTQAEGEIQNLSGGKVSAELWEIIAGQKPGRIDDDEITLFDAVGVAVEDFSVLKLVYDLATDMEIGKNIELIPNLADPKDLFSVLSSVRTPPRLYRQSI